jgi:TPR repeat protein
MYGDGVPQNLEEAIKWFRRAGEQGYVPAQKKICFLSDNLREAEHWCLRASGAQGEVGTLRHDEAGSRTQEQKAEAQRIVEQDAEVIQIQLF